MSKIKTFRDLIAWQKAMDLVEKIYKVTNEFPENEQYNLISQLRRATISIPSNIAEGYGRKSKKDYLRFLQIAISSLYEVQTQIEISYRINYLSKKVASDITQDLLEVERILTFLASAIRKSNNNIN